MIGSALPFTLQRSHKVKGKRPKAISGALEIIWMAAVENSGRAQLPPRPCGRALVPPARVPLMHAPHDRPIPHTPTLQHSNTPTHTHTTHTPRTHTLPHSHTPILPHSNTHRTTTHTHTHAHTHTRTLPVTCLRRHAGLVCLPSGASQRGKRRSPGDSDNIASRGKGANAFLDKVSVWQCVCCVLCGRGGKSVV